MQTIDSLHLFKSLIKDGCEWHGDVLSRKWSENLFFSEQNKDQVMRTLEGFKEGEDYKLDGLSIWIA